MLRNAKKKKSSGLLSHTAPNIDALHQNLSPHAIRLILLVVLRHNLCIHVPTPFDKFNIQLLKTALVRNPKGKKRAGKKRKKNLFLGQLIDGFRHLQAPVTKPLTVLTTFLFARLLSAKIIRKENSGRKSRVGGGRERLGRARLSNPR